MKKIILMFFLTSSIFAQVEYSRGGDKGQFLPQFFIDLASYDSQDSGKSKIDVFIKVPYSNIQFIKIQNEYRAKYSLVVSVYDDDENLKLEKLWNEKITTQSFQQTVSQTSFNLSYKSFILASGDYKFVCRLEDLESKKYSVFEQDIKLRMFEDSIDISDIVLASRFIETDEGTKTIPNISNLVSSADSSLSFFFEVYSDKPREIKILYSINNMDGIPQYSVGYDFVLNKGKNEINETFKNIAFSLGDYQLEIKILDKNGDTIKRIRKNFASKLFGFPASIRDLDIAVKQMQFIASPSDVEKIEDAGDYSERLKSFIVYWKKLDPSPNTVENETLNEYYRRVDYANKAFKGYFKGWRSDMGMVFITLGPPDQVTRRPYEMDSKPYEVWDYYVVNKRFVFVDQTNFGDYRLQNPAYGDWFRYRP
jgi:GWxTD domain-containing protein